MLQFTLKVGAKIFYDSSFGLLPAVIVDVYDYGYGLGIEVMLKLTMRKKVGPYNPGEFIITSPLRAIPREAVKRGRILPYTYTNGGA